MKVLHILYSGLGGHGNVFFSMVDADSDKNFIYEALFYGIEEAREGYIKKAENRSLVWHFVKKKPGFDLSSYRAIMHIIKNSRPDVIFLHSSAYIFPAWLAAFFTSSKIKIVVRETQPNHLKTKLEWVGLSFALLAAKKVVFLSIEYRDAIKRILSLFFSNKRTAVIPNGIDLTIFKPHKKPEDNNLKIGMQSRLSSTKDHATLIKAFFLLLKAVQPVNNIQLCIAGDGDCRPDLEKLSLDLLIADKVIFKGMLEENELPDFINSLDIYIHATLGETMSTAIMQVMACRKPIIASDVLGVNNMIKNEVNGILVRAKDEKGLAKAIQFILDNPLIKNQYAESAYNFAVEHYSNRKMYLSYQSIFEQS